MPGNNLLKISLIVTFCLVFGWFLKPGLSWAHTLAKDGKISAFLHIEPNDQPRPGQINTIHIYFNDQDFRFTTEGCDCKIKLTEGQQILYNGILPASGDRVGQLKALLPKDNFSYDVVVSGTPKTAGFFQPFKLKFDIDVGTPPPVAPPPQSHIKLFAAATVVVLLATGSGYYALIRKK
jgi:hypothetical protein